MPDVNNSTIARIKEIDGQIAQLDAILNNGTYAAAGLDISVHVGPARDRAPALRMQASFDVEALLQAMRASLVRSREMNIIFARRELRDLEAYMAPGGKK